MKYYLLTLHSKAKSPSATDEYSDYVCKGEDPATPFLEIRELCQEIYAHHAPVLVNVLEITQAQALNLNEDVDL